MENAKTVIDAIFNYLSEESKKSLLDQNGNIDYSSKAAGAWVDAIDCDGDLEVGSRYSASGTPELFRFDVLNQVEIEAAMAADGNAPSPVYSY